MKPGEDLNIGSVGIVGRKKLFKLLILFNKEKLPKKIERLYKFETS
jgi:hypothetical protein